MNMKDLTIAITRGEGNAEEVERYFENLGVNLVLLPTLEIVAVDSGDAMRAALQDPSLYCIVFQSANAVRFFMQIIQEKKIPIDYNRVKIAAIGKKTEKACIECNVFVNIIPDEYSSVGLLKKLAQQNVNRKTFLVPNSSIGRHDLAGGLRKLGAKVRTVNVYNVQLPSKEKMNEILWKYHDHRIDWFLFTSPSSYENFIKILDIENPPEFFKNFKIAVIGPTTKTAVENSNVHVDVVPKVFTVHDAAAGIVNYYKSREKTSA